MTILINFIQKPLPGYTPRKAITLHNVARVEDQGVRMIRVLMMFSDNKSTYDHVASVSITPQKEDYDGAKFEDVH